MIWYISVAIKAYSKKEKVENKASQCQCWIKNVKYHIKSLESGFICWSNIAKHEREDEA